MTTGSPMYTTKPSSYFSHVRQDVLALIPPGSRRLLDVGCGAGATAAAARRDLGVEAWGIESIEAAAATATTTLDRVIVGDVETTAIPCADGYFDCILCADVLEHLRDPWSTLRSLQRVLQPAGAIVLSLPNVRQLVPILRIIFDRFEYETEGVCDRTHLRFFTLHTIRQMLQETGYRVEHLVAKRRKGWKWKSLQVATLGLVRPFTIDQYLVVARKDHGLS
jgi:2-polyprenyl-3-methyl-5-hydroxy-6-metoxy-1,4-benzoquinol methylase